MKRHVQQVFQQTELFFAHLLLNLLLLRLLLILAGYVGGVHGRALVDCLPLIWFFTVLFASKIFEKM